MEVLRAGAGDEVLVVTWWRDREAFDEWVHSEELNTPYTHAPTLTLKIVK
jgi:heme-degrading monooxygenase HmoA